MRALPFVLGDPAPRAWIEEVGDSSIVLTFAPWIDQTHTDFLKAKSAAIRAVKMALEEGGFTLPEPIYRLRVDQVPPGLLGRAEVTEGAAPQRKRPAPAAAPVPAEDDVSADRTLAEKVEEDRRVGGPGDLLKSDGPTEFGDEA
jgi:hypothetical protein